MAPAGINVIDFGAVPNAIYDLVPNSEFQQFVEYRLPGQNPANNNYPAGAARVHWHAIVGIASISPPVSAWKDFIWNNILSVLPPAPFNSLQDLNGDNGDLIVNKDSAANGQIGLATTFTSTIHTSFPGMANFNVQTEVQSPLIAAKVKELLSTNNPADWQGDLKP